MPTQQHYFESHDDGNLVFEYFLLLLNFILFFSIFVLLFEDMEYSIPQLAVNRIPFGRECAVDTAIREKIYSSY